ncbi:MAG: hypothetical protein JNM78_01885 [Cyclobacteriaceae bacterium]|nr:hypothetical protein [Cyclobacteriaceae bacterium]
MRKILILLLFTPFLTSAQTGDKNFIDQNYIEVTGKSELQITPDLIPVIAGRLTSNILIWHP